MSDDGASPTSTTSADAALVRDYLEASMVPDPDRAATYMAPAARSPSPAVGSSTIRAGRPR